MRPKPRKWVWPAKILVVPLSKVTKIPKVAVVRVFKSGPAEISKVDVTTTTKTLKMDVARPPKIPRLAGLGIQHPYSGREGRILKVGVAPSSRKWAGR